MISLLRIVTFVALFGLACLAWYGIRSDNETDRGAFLVAYGAFSVSIGMLMVLTWTAEGGW